MYLILGRLSIFETLNLSGGRGEDELRSVSFSLQCTENVVFSDR